VASSSDEIVGNAPPPTELQFKTRGAIARSCSKATFIRHLLDVDILTQVATLYRNRLLQFEEKVLRNFTKVWRLEGMKRIAGRSFREGAVGAHELRSGSKNAPARAHIQCALTVA
jgi:hypothetical protein